MLNERNNLLRDTLMLSFLSFFLLTASCGYTIVKEKGVFQGEVASIDVPVFKNTSFEPQISQFFTEAFTRELIVSGLFDVNKGGSTSTLQGTISNTRIVPSAMDANGLVIQKVIYVSVTLSMMKNDGRPIKSWPMLDAEPYDVQDINQEDPNKKQALVRIAGRMSRRFSALVLGDIDRKAF